MTKTTSQDNEKGTIGGEKVPILLSKRWILAYIGMVGFFFIYSLRVNLSVAIVCMVKDDVNKTTSTNLSTSNEATCTADTPSNSTNNGEFDWDKDTQSLMLSAFFYGYIVLQVPGGWMAGRFGGKRVLGIGVLVTAIATVLLPVAARQDHRAVYALRVIMGLAEGVSFPCMHSMWGRWSPTMERTRLASFTYAGLNVGNVVTYIVSGLLCAYGFDNGWAAIFYLTGGAAFIWVFAWFVFVYDSPEDHPSISQAERDYIVSHRGDKQTKKFKVPWKSVVKSRAMWMCLGAHLCNNWMHYTLLTGLPTFMKQVLKYDIKQASSEFVL
ncbi:sialin [Aplysia californica]|uniref:Sialin n=1 Tax=Aplysia californica TaxID=6500 RepID=A0ABM1A9E7_APLCA|nr:sialin [Aplysia californica]